MTDIYIKTTQNVGGQIEKLWITMWKLGISRKVLYTHVIFEKFKKWIKLSENLKKN